MSTPLYKIVERELLEYFAAVVAEGRSGVLLGKGTGYEVFVPAELLPTLDEWQRDPELRTWAARVPPYVLRAWRGVRRRQETEAGAGNGLVDNEWQPKTL